MEPVVEHGGSTATRSAFDCLVGALEAERAWRHRVWRVRAGVATRRIGRMAGLGLGSVGSIFGSVPMTCLAGLAAMER